VLQAGLTQKHVVVCISAVNFFHRDCNRFTFFL
jgi:hypothetical protein